MTKEILNVLESPELELSLSFVNDQEIAELNQRFRNHSRPTDVLSFSMREGDFSDLNPFLLGDVVISVETAQKQSTSLGHSLAEEIARLLIHGILHLLGYDHETSGASARAMRKKERELLALLREKIPALYSPESGASAL